MALLEIKDLKVSYGFITALKGINISVEEGQIVTLLGSNGAGKTTTLRTISGAIKPESGSILLDGKEISGLPTYKIAKAGITQSPEGRLLFSELTVEENAATDLKIRIKNPKGEKFTFMSQYNGEKELTFEKDGDDYIVTMPSLNPWSTGTIFIA